MTTGTEPATDTRRVVSARIEADVVDVATIVLAIAVADHHSRVDERLQVLLDGDELAVRDVAAPHAGRLQVLDDVRPGRLEVDYRAAVVGAAPTLPVSDLEPIRYVRPSRYCESDRLGPLARAEFGGLAGHQLLAAVSGWVRSNISYVTGSSRPIDGAVATLLAREGVCRDFAHVSASLLRANDVAARIASVYAPGLDPMDFHAVTEAWVDGAWYVVDPTGLAPRRSMVRIATGADAAGTAFLTNLGGAVELVDMDVVAIAEPTLPTDDGVTPTELD